MHLNLLHLLVAIIVAALAWWANAELSPPPIGKIVRVLIVVVFVLFLLADIGLMGSRVQIG